VSALGPQINSAVAHNVDYVTVLVGGNDVCQSTEAQMTPVATFQSQFHQQLAALVDGLPNAKILVVSIPDLYRTWEIGKDNPSAVAAWQTSVCMSMFANPTSTDQADIDRRARVRQRIIDDNAALADECGMVSHCKYDGGALFMHQWTTDEISTVDYLHPSTTGQNAIAALTYAAGYNW
jgi:lysophospholipase L1-like esterase